MESAIEKVFSNAELVEIILEYCCNGQHWNDGLRLRQVCKLWRDNSFKGLLQCKYRPWVKLPNDLEEFQEIVPEKCSIPLKLKFPRRIETNMISFIGTNSKYITNLEFCVSSVAKTPQDCVFQLLNLRNVSVQLTSNFWLKDFSKLEELLSQVVKKSRHLKKFSLTVDPNGSLPVGVMFPPRITHLNVHTKFIEAPLTSLMEGDLKHLVDLCLVIVDPRSAGMEQVKKVFDKYSDQLTSSNLFLKTISCNSRELKLPPISSLKGLHVEKLHGINIEGLTTNFFLGFANLTTLHFGFANWLSLIKPGTTFEHLKILCVYGEFEEATIEQMEALESLGSFDLPKLEHLKCGYFKPKTLRSFVPMFFKKSIGLRSLFLDAIFYEPFQLTSLLTGKITNIDVLKKTCWPRYADSLTPFTDLKCLETLSIANEDYYYKYDIEPFVFRCAFLQMPSLKKLNITKNIMVRKSLAKNWKEAGKKLYLIKNLLEH